MSVRTGYSINKPTGTCASSGRELTVGETYIAVLVERDEGFAREDYTIEAWETGARPAGVLVGSWRAVAEREGRKKQALVGSDELMELFEQLAETEDEARLAFRYVLALILIRKKQLLYEGTCDRMVLVRPRGVSMPPEGPPLLEVVDPGMTDARIQEVSEQLTAVVDEGGV